MNFDASFFPSYSIINLSYRAGIADEILAKKESERRGGNKRGRERYDASQLLFVFGWLRN